MKFLTNLFNNLKQARLTRDATDAADLNDFKRVLELIDQGADVNGIAKITVCNEGGCHSERWNVGAIAIDKGNNRVLQILLDRGLNPDLAGGAGDSPRSHLLTYAILRGNEEAALLLIGRGAKLDHVLPDLTTLSELAQQRSLTEVTKVISAKQKEASDQAVEVSALASDQAIKVSGRVQLRKPVNG